MNTDLAMGLVTAGSVGQSFLARMPLLQAHLGPIKANSPQAARLAARILRAGYGVTHYSALEFCDLIWVAVPERALDRTLRELAAQMPIRETMVVLCDCARTSDRENPLSKMGARIASLNAVSGTRESYFIAEGHPDVTKAIKRLLSRDKRKLLLIPPESKPLYFSGIYAATHMLLPIVDTSVQFLRAAGFARADAVDVTEALVRGVMKQYQNVGSKSWGERDAEALHRLLAEDISKIAAGHPDAAETLRKGVALALSHFAPVKVAAGA